MKIVHETIIRPELGREIEVAGLLNHWGAAYSAAPGYMEGYTLDGLEEGRLLARVSVWGSEEAADPVAKLERVVDLGTARKCRGSRHRRVEDRHRH